MIALLISITVLSFMTIEAERHEQGKDTFSIALIERVKEIFTGDF